MTRMSREMESKMMKETMMMKPVTITSDRYSVEYLINLL
jgi:hypothetical protein